MKFCIVPRRLARLIPMKVYCNNIVIASWIAKDHDTTFYWINYDCYSYFKSEPLGYLVLYNLTDEDLTHLNLLGLVIKETDFITNPQLEDVILNRTHNFNFTGGQLSVYT